MKIHVIRYNGLFDTEELHEITLPEKKGRYVQFSTLTGFHRRELSRHVRAIERRHHLDFFYEVAFNWKMAVHREPELATMPRQTHGDVWAFYKAIGYDHRRNKFQEMTCSKS